MREVKIFGDVTKIDNGAEIGDSAFGECVNLTEIKIPPRVNSVGEGVFHNCGSLKELTLPKGVVKFGK